MTSGGSSRGREWPRKVPFTVTIVAAFSGLFTLRGISTYPPDFSAFPYHLDPLYYVATLFIHSGASHYLANMYFFVPAGLILAYLTSNRRVSQVVLVSHLPTAFVCSLLGLSVIGAGAAAYGLLAAVLVHATWYCAGSYSGTVRVTSSIGVLALAALALVVATGGALTAYIIPVSGFVLGGTYESWRILHKFGHEEDDWSDVLDEVSFHTPRFKSRWENMAGGDQDEAERLEKRHSSIQATPDDTYAGSRGRGRGG
jgi:membrane associated rhomboid family serine protease